MKCLISQIIRDFFFWEFQSAYMTSVYYTLLVAHIFTHLKIALKSGLERHDFQFGNYVFKLWFQCNSQVSVQQSMCNKFFPIYKMSNVGFIPFTSVSDHIESWFIFAGCFEGYQY